MPKKIPTPFQRPLMTVSSGSRRVWRDQKASLLSLGDLVREQGEVQGIEKGLSVSVTFFNGSVLQYGYHDIVFAFTEGDPIGNC